MKITETYVLYIIMLCKIGFNQDKIYVLIVKYIVWLPQLEIALLNAIFRLQRICGCVLSSSKTEKMLFFCGLFFCPLICAAKFDDNERSAGTHCNMLPDEDMSNWANQPPVHTVQEQITSYLRPHSYSLLLNKTFTLFNSKQLTTCVIFWNMYMYGDPVKSMAWLFGKWPYSLSDIELHFW